MFSKKIKTVISSINNHPLARKHRFTAYSKFFKWQLSQFLFPGIKRVPFIQDTVLLAKKGMSAATGNIYCGLQEFNDMAFLLHFLREEDVFADVGANIGSYTILASGICKAYTVSIEPVPETFAYLQENINANLLAGRTELWNAAAGAAECRIKFTSSFGAVNHVLSEEEDNTAYIEVDLYPLSKMLKGKLNIRLIKIDAEGFETEVLNGMHSIMENEALKAIIIELNGSGGRYGYNENDIHRKLLQYNFAPFTYDPFKKQLLPLDTYTDQNTIYLRDIDFIEKRIASSKTIRIFSEGI